jgi:putative flippase GtrA
LSRNISEPVAQALRYLVAGAFNTIFGYGLFALFNWLLTGRMKYSYLFASLLANMIAITVAFLLYKWFVFRTKGNYLMEWLRVVGVYSSSMLITLGGLAVLVPVLHRIMPHPEWASYLAGGIMAVVTVVISFLGHKHFSFRAGAKPAVSDIE